MITAEQQQAIKSKEKKILVRAGAGTGKTEVLTRRVLHLIEQDPTLSIREFVIITFTNKATENILARLKRYFYHQWKKETHPSTKERFRYELDILNVAQISTIHKFCQHILELAGPFQVHNAIYAPTYTVGGSTLYEAVSEVLNRWIEEHPEGHSLLNALPVFKIRQYLLQIYTMIRGRGIPIHEAIQQTENTAIIYEQGNVQKIKFTIASLLQRLDEEHRKRKLYQLDPDDLLEYAYLILRENPSVVRRIRQQYRHIFVDEFQDTSLFQAEILRLICEGEEPVPSLFVVGDSKQSIYQFRGANIDSYRTTETWIRQEGTVLHLKQNFRSVKPLVEYVNQTFRRLALDEKAPAFEPEDLVPHRTAALPNETFIYPFQLQGMEPAKRTALFLQEQLQNGEKPEDFAILFRTNRDMTAFEEELTRLQIPCRVIGAGDFYRKKEIVDMYRVLNYLVTPQDSIKIELALDTEIIANNKDMLTRLYGQLQYRSEQRTVAQILERIYEETGLRQRYASYGNIQALANLDRLKEITRALTKRERIQLVEYVTWLATKITTDTDEKQAEVLDNSLDAVTLITVHSAKGLEFPYVILPQLDRKLDAETLLPAFLYNTKTGVEFSFKYYKESSFISSSYYTESRDQYLAEYLAEEARVLYVALTRAEKRIYLLINEEASPATSYQQWLRV